MGGVLRITRAEFIKIFKKPSVFIMGIILAFTLVVSLLFFEPENKPDVRVNINGTNINEIYEKFNGDLGTDTKNKYNTNITISENKINFYTSLNERNSNIETAITALNEAYANFSKLVSIKESSEEDKELLEKKKDEAYALFNSSITALQTETNDFTNLSDNKFIIEYQKQDSFKIITTKINELNKTITESVTDYTTMIRNIESNERITNVLNTVNDNKNFIKNTLIEEINKLTIIQNDYYYHVINSPDGEEANRKNYWNNLYNQLTNVKTLLSTLTNSEHAFIFIKTTALKTINTNILNYENTLDYLTTTTEDIADYKKHSNLIINLNKNKLNNVLKNQISTIKNFKVDNEILTAITKTKAIILSRTSELEKQMTEYKNNNSASADISKKSDFNLMVSKYKELTSNFKTYTDINVILNATNDIKITDINNYNTFEKFNLYETNENNSVLNYLIANNIYSFSYDDIFSYNRNSSYTTTAWDFMFYAMKIASIIIVIFTIMMAANLVASEHDSGTIKLLAIRPYKRTKIITGKLFATLFFAIIFILFSAIIGLIAGVCMYPLTTTPILAIFNGTQVFSVSPIILMLINIISIILEVGFFTIIAISLSTIFRSFAGAVSTSLIIFILALSLNILLGAFIWYSFIPFMNIDFFRFLGGAFLTSGSNPLSSVFSAPVLNISNFFISLGIYVGTLSIFLFITYMVFKKRDF